MTQDEAVSQAQGGIASSLQALFKAGVDSVQIPAPAPVVGADASEQEKIDAAVAQAVGPLQGQIAALQAAGVELQSKLDAETALEAADQATIAQVKGVIAQIAALVAPAPVASAPVASV